ncbi:hypothetical protein P3719_21805 [Vibrio parahaemolyticus]|nr:MULTISPECIES: hypothetical protein [Vibrio]APX09794.1 hypothetical protein BWP24_26645 [Vibrio campbellii]MBE8573070.1 hypothetical protein [Vibrio sp. OPT46]MCS0382432.1 hypothetical protein [Vibrio diabolicus]MDW1669003.1 hypothetical protein [Vibrio sp. Vb2978]MDW1773273.1 hypothetical protein [Vibrio sp. Vb2354]MDW1867781.1 hypothetical protein [Vibrio sp. Vb1127]MDW2188634.1 hypothetical protein [Vibrio sp. 1733]OOH98652.1 hypothetical protein BIW16_18805 [Vibrio sp. OULL4]
MNKKLMLAVMLSASLFGCAQNDSLDPVFGFTGEYGAGGTRIPNNPAYLVDPGLTTETELFKIFGEPQLTQSFPWGRVVTYRYWENKIGLPMYEEYVDFVFNDRGFLDKVATYSQRGSKRVETNQSKMIEREEECPSHYTVCQSYENFSH